MQERAPRRRTDGPQQNSFARGLDVLITISRNGQSTVAEIAAELGLPPSTVYRYVRSLRDYALIEESAGTYLPGWRLMDIAGHHLTHTKLVEAGTKYLRELTYQTSETSVIAVRAGTQAICLRQVISPLPQPYAFKVNELLPLYAGAGQRILLAYAPRAVVDAVLPKVVQVSPSTPTVDQMPQLLDQARRLGYVISRGEYQAGSVAVAMPVVVDGEVVCSLTLAGPAERCGNDQWVGRALRLLNPDPPVLIRGW